MREAKALVRVRVCADSSDRWLVPDAICTKILYIVIAGHNTVVMIRNIIWPVHEILVLIASVSSEG